MRISDWRSDVCSSDLQLKSDTLCIPVGAPHPKNAHAFINYILDAEVDKKITETILYPTPNTAAKALMTDDYRNNPVIFPPADVLARCEYATLDRQSTRLKLQSLKRIPYAVSCSKQKKKS